jgi:hypothetical protein
MATKKPATPSDEKLEQQDFDLFKALDAIDSKNYAWYSKLTEEQRKKFVPYMITHWASAIKAKGMLGAYYVMSVDANANKYLFNEVIQGHPELQWLMLCAASPGMGKQFHQWIPHLSDKQSQLRERADAKSVKEYYAKIYPSVSKDDIAAAADGYVAAQRHKFRLARLYPEMKLDEIELLSTLITEEQIDQYEKESGN